MSHVPPTVHERRALDPATARELRAMLDLAYDGEFSDDDGLMFLRTRRTPRLDPAGTIVADWRSGDVW